MPRQLWNEGRVVGYSAYEIYVRHHLETDPDTTPATEEEWLASMMAMGSSMLLKIPAGSSGTFEVDFPQKSRLCAANNIIASFFGGDAAVDANGWATKVTDYGPLINNTTDAGPTFPNVETLPNTTINQIGEYMKIVDGIVVQPGTWTVNPNNPPKKDFSPTLSEKPKIRILLNGEVENAFFICFTGFTNKSVVGGQTGLATAVNTQSPADGDFLGPWAFPWSAKIFFNIPSSFVNYFITNKYARKLPITSEVISVTSEPIIDMKSGNPESFYTANFNDSKQDILVTDINTVGEDAAVFVTFSKSENLPPALYGSLISQKDGATTDNIIYPIDTVAPGTIKLYQEDGNMFADINELQTYVSSIESAVPFNYGFYRELTSAVIMHRDPVINEFVPVSNDETINLAGVCTYNTEYAWFRAMGAGGDFPRHDEMNNIGSFIIAEGWRGYVSQEFIDKYCIPLDAVADATASEKSKTFIYNIDNYRDSGGIEQISEYYRSIPNNERHKYGIVITSSYSSSFSEPSQQYSGLLVRLNDGAISQITFGEDNLPFGLNFNHGYTQNQGYKPKVTQYLGTWWSNSGSYADSDGTEIFSEHNTLLNSVPDYNSFYQNAAVATPVSNGSGAKYGKDFRAWFKYTPMSTLLSDLGMTWNDCTWTADGTTKKVHKDYKKLSILTFLMKCMTRKDLSKPDNGDNAKTNPGTKTMYLYPKSALRTVKPWTNNITATCKVEWSKTGAAFYQPSLWKFSELSDDTWIDKTPEFVRSDSTIWASIGTSGHNQTTAISLVDKYGAQLPTQGTGGTIDGDYLIWGDLLSALNQNKKIDILESVLRNLKVNVEESGPNFIKFKNSPRLYIADADHIPDDEDIPDGSIGIGW